MGRPLNKRYFGEPSGGNFKLVPSLVWIEGMTEAATGFYILKQTGTGRYLVSNGTDNGEVTLVDGAPTGPGEATIVVNPIGGSEEYARVVYSRTVSTFEGNNYAWSLDPADVLGEADIPVVEEIPTEPSGSELIMTAAASGTFIGYSAGDFGSITGSIADYTVKAIYDDVDTDESTVSLEGDYTGTGSIVVTITEFTVVTLDIIGYDAVDNVTLFSSSVLFNFVVGSQYTIESVVAD